MIDSAMLTHSNPKSNNERQRAFRARNPGYYNKYYARRKAGTRHAAAAWLAAGQTAQAAAAAAAQATAEAPVPAPAPAPALPSA
jgi:hypothetical protein